MRVPVLDDKGKEIGSRLIPDDVIAAAQKVRAWMLLQDRPPLLCGLRLSDHPAAKRPL